MISRWWRHRRFPCRIGWHLWRTDPDMVDVSWCRRPHCPAIQSHTPDI